MSFTTDLSNIGSGRSIAQLADEGTLDLGDDFCFLGFRVLSGVVEGFLRFFHEKCLLSPLVHLAVQCADRPAPARVDSITREQGGMTTRRIRRCLELLCRALGLGFFHGLA